MEKSNLLLCFVTGCILGAFVNAIVGVDKSSCFTFSCVDDDDFVEYV